MGVKAPASGRQWADGEAWLGRLQSTQGMYSCTYSHPSVVSFLYSPKMCLTVYIAIYTHIGGLPKYVLYTPPKEAYSVDIPLM